MSPQKRREVFTEEHTINGRKLIQFRESWMKRDFCYNKRVGKGETYRFPEDSPIKQFRNEVYTEKIPVCESHLKLSQRNIKRSEKFGWTMERNKKFTLIIILDIILTFIAEDFGLGFIFIADPWINFSLDLLLTIFHLFLYDPYLVLIVFVLKSFILIPSVAFGLISILPYHYIVLIIGAMQRKNAKRGIVGFKNKLETFYGDRQFVLMNLYPEPIFPWSKYGAKNPPKLREVKNSSQTPSFTPSKKTEVVASRINKRFGK